ncbi:hypothetical protein [Lactococcus lactis]|uniref:hypothetical protein n=2 Tax=Lactococcus lactis TaxID=1358 RepID=UPI00071C2C2D|nr:hypothetical protein [Lactococcus lactis]KST80953.1 hypothetical protein LK231_0624 [Lactococcus lactis subsp. lactis]MCG6979394.1 hypothetical protein [Lactococcus lactis]MDO6176931.1 hypothetical protein [Lactococcus lactis]MDU0410861.1 hypothetical protein [Lactococcus lactis]
MMAEDKTINEIAKCFSGTIKDSKILKCILKQLNFKAEKEITYSNNVVIEELIDSKAGVYAFEITNKGNLLAQAEVSELKNLWDCRKNENVPRANKISNNQWLYVGRDFTDINNRIKAHLGQGSKSTYALKLGAINKENEQEQENKEKYSSLENLLSTRTITCYRFTISEEMDDIIRAGYIAMIEGILHEKLKPILGKK